MKKTTIIQMVMVAIIMVLPLVILAQPPAGQPFANGSDPDATPIDGGLSLLVAAGVGYGAKKMKERRNKEIKEAKS